MEDLPAHDDPAHDEQAEYERAEYEQAEYEQAEYEQAEYDARELVVRIQRLAPVLVAHRIAVAAELGLGLRDLVVLELLDRIGPLDIGTIAERVGLSPAAASRLVDRLESRDLGGRVSDPLDARHVPVAADPEAATERRALLATLDEDLRVAIGRIDPARRREVSDLVADIADAVHRRTRAYANDREHATRRRHAVTRRTTRR